jgi:Ubiquitin-conjugating enzyme
MLNNEIDAVAGANMSPNEKTKRAAQDLAALEAIRQASSIFTFQVHGEPAERFIFTFRGAGLQRGTASNGEPERASEHRAEVRLPYAYPQQPPDIRWLTAIFHPNVSFSGFVNLSDINLTWEPGMGLDVVCERLWDCARLADFNLGKAVSFSAKQWIEKQSVSTLPIDARPLRDRAASINRNVVKYRRKGEPVPAAEQGEILFIDNDTTPVPLAPAEKRPGERPAQRDDILYIDE